jgi:hypothetical protein
MEICTVISGEGGCVVTGRSCVATGLKQFSMKVVLFRAVIGVVTNTEGIPLFQERMVLLGRWLCCYGIVQG